MTFPIILVCTLRISVIIGCLYNLRWSAAGLLAVRAGRQSLLDIVRAAVAMSVLAVLVFQGGNLIEPAEITPWRIVGLLLLLLSMILFRWIHIRAKRKGIDTLDKIFAHTGEALAIADLAAVDQAAALALADEARRLTAERIARGG